MWMSYTEWNRIKSNIIRVTEYRAEKARSEEIMAKNFSELMKNMNLQIEHTVNLGLKTKPTQPKYFTVKLQNIKDREGLKCSLGTGHL